MTATFRSYTAEPGFTGDFRRVRDFLVRVNEPVPEAAGFHWGRWEWGFSLPYLDKANLARMGVWEDDGQIVALMAYEQGLGQAWPVVDSRYSFLKPEMLRHAAGRMAKDGSIKVLISDTDRELQKAAWAMGFRATQEKEQTAVLEYSEAAVAYALPEGYRIVSLADEFDMQKYCNVLWRGFNHGDTPPETAEELEERRVSVSGPSVNLSLKVAVAAPDGQFVSFCGMWYEPGTENALVEPVATDPRYRRMGMGRAAVLEGVKRCGELGTKRAFVGSSQQFYYSIGFAPYSNETFWELKV